MSKLQEAITLGLMVLAFGLGYGFRNAQVTPVTTTDQVKDNHTVVVTTTTKARDGTIKVVRTIDSDIKTNTKENKQARATTGMLNISALAGYDFSARLPIQVYGISINKQVLGNLTVGAFGLTNGTIGVSLGMNF